MWRSYMQENIVTVAGYEVKMRWVSELPYAGFHKNFQHTSSTGTGKPLRSCTDSPIFRRHDHGGKKLNPTSSVCL